VLNFLLIIIKSFVYFFLGNSLASKLYMPTFQNTLFNLHRWVVMKNDHFSYLPAYEDGTESLNITLPTNALVVV